MAAQLSPEEARDFLERVEADCRPSASFYGLIFLASTIATFGLLANSAAVIIGAMLVAPLMNAIIGVAAGVVLNRRTLLQRATFSLVTGALLALGTGLVLSAVSPVTAPGSEILGRVRPTLYDLWVAAAAGLAGAYSLVRARTSAALPGVAIATALVPPLVTAGIELRLAQVSGAMGALLLFVSNMVAITCSGMAVFAFYGLHRYVKSELTHSPTRLYLRWGGSFVAVAVLLAHSLQQVVYETATEGVVRDTLSSQVRMIPGATVDRFELSQEQRSLVVRASVATPNSVSPPMVASTERLLSSRLKRPVRLVVRSVITKDADANAYLQQETPAARNLTPLEVVEKVLREQSQALPGGVLEDYSVSRNHNGYRVTARYRTAEPLDPLLIRGIRNLLANALGSPVDLQVEEDRQPGMRQPVN